MAACLGLKLPRRLAGVAQRRLAFAAAAVAVLSLAAASSAAQSTPRPQLYVIRNAALGIDAAAPRATLVLRDGRIERVLPPDAQTPLGAREVDASSLVCVPAFVDACTAAGCATPEPKSDRDQPPSTRSDVQVDMRDANRKGIQPAFRAALAFDLPKDKGKALREAGFGALLSCPAGQLLAGTSALASTRDAAMRDTLIAPDVFLHAAFGASGAGYPSTLMGYAAQLRQFLMDARRHRELRQRWAAGRPGPRPPFDADLETAQALFDEQGGERRVACEANGAADIERWIALSEQLDFRIAIAGGREAWRVREKLAARGIPVILTLDWGEEAKDPHEKDKKKKAGQEKPAETTEKPPDEAPGAEAPQEPAQPTPEKKPEADPLAPPAEPRPEQAPEEKKPEDKKAESDYEEPLGVREERRRRWEEGRDCALRLREAGVAFAFGSGTGSASELLKKVRTLVEVGLPAEEALAALTGEAASVLGAEQELGALEPGRGATLALWTKSPLDKEAKLAWLFVDGFPYEFELDQDSGDKGKPDEGVDVTGSWELEIVGREGARKGTAELKMEPEGSVEGTITSPSFGGESTTTEFKGHVSKKTMTLEGKTTRGDTEIALVVRVEIEGDAFSGDWTVKGSFGERSSPVTGTRKPKRNGFEEEVRR